MTSASQSIAAFARRRKRLLIVSATLLALVYLPMVPYSPGCYDPYEATSVGSIRLAPRYRAALIENLRAYDVSYASIGPFVLLRLWTWVVDPGDWAFNASTKAVSRFVDERFGAVPENIPSAWQGLIAESRKSHGYLRVVCPLARAVAIEGFRTPDFSAR